MKTVKFSLFSFLIVFISVLTISELNAEDEELKGAIIREDGKMVFVCPHDRREIRCTCGCNAIY
jgi:hypothetical protein